MSPALTTVASGQHATMFAGIPLRDTMARHPKASPLTIAMKVFVPIAGFFLCLFLQNVGNQRLATIRDPHRRILSRVRCIALFARLHQTIVAPGHGLFHHEWLYRFVPKRPETL